MGGIVVQNMLWRVVGGLAIALTGALLALWAHLPLPWMLGALLLTAAVRIAGGGTVCPRPARNAGQWVIGTSLGLYFTPQVIGHIGSNAGPIIVGMLFALGLAFIGTAILRRYTDADFKTAWFSSAMGGASISYIGVYAINAGTFDLLLVTGIGAIGYFLRKFGVPMAPLVLGVVLGNMMEQNLRRALSITDGNLSVLFASPVAIALWTAAIAVVVVPQILRRMRRARKVAAEPV